MKINEFWHYIIVYVILLIAWDKMMEFTNNVTLTALIVFGVFIAADQTAHKWFI